MYIIRFLDVDNLIHASTKTTCSKKEILEALEGVFLLEYRLSVDDSTELYSGWSYGEFRWRYIKRLEERIEEIMCMRAFMLIYVYIHSIIKFGHLHSPSMLPYQPLHYRICPLEITGSEIQR